MQKKLVLVSPTSQRLVELFGLDDRVEVIQGDGSIGYPQNAPYDRIYFAVWPNKDTFDPNILLAQLNDGGILLYPERESESFLKRSKIPIAQSHCFSME